MTYNLAFFQRFLFHSIHVNWTVQLICRAFFLVFLVSAVSNIVHNMHDRIIINDVALIYIVDFSEIILSQYNYIFKWKKVFFAQFIQD